MNSSMLLRRLCLFVLVMVTSLNWGYGTHLRAGEITVERVSCNSLTFRITVTVFTDATSTVQFGGEDDWLDFGDGTRRLIPSIPSTPRPDLGTNVGIATFTIPHTYSGFQAYTISYSEPNRNRGVVNMDASVDTRFYIETRIIVDPFLGCNNTPKLLIPPIDQACTGVAFFHNPGAYDPDGDSLSYEIVVPFRERNATVINYKSPNDPKFYTNVGTGNENANGPATFTINPADGTITWDAPGSLMRGEYNIAFHIIEWRKINDQWFSMGFVRRDMQILVEECKNERPDLIVPENICVVAGTTITETIFGIDPDNHDVKIEAFSEVFNFAQAESPAIYSPRPATFGPSVPPKQLQFQWNTECRHVKDQPYQVVFKITDNPPLGPKLVTFKTWFITVVGPEPEFVNANLNVANRSVALQWEPYVCDNATQIQVWRKVDSYAFTPAECQTGMPPNLGYELIQTLNLRDASNNPVTSFLDTNRGQGLAFGAQYCYRLVALFPAPKGGESYVSDEICVDPIIADAPVITNVSVIKTATASGEILVRWTKPFEINRAQFPGPFEYEVYRATGFSGENGLTLVSGPGRLPEDVLEIVDRDPLLNTKDNVYNYRVRLYSNTAQSPAYSLIKTSAAASTVRLDAESSLENISLTWSAVVPWSNVVQTTPNEHVIYRGPAGATEATLVQYVLVDPTDVGFSYVDDGLSTTTEYCYRVLTRGAYGNPAIPEPLENFSQIVCAVPNDEEPPCAPVLTVDKTNCEEFIATAACDINSFSNVLRWERPSGACGDDILGYKIYRAAQADGDYVWLEQAGINGIVRETTFTDNGENGIGLNSLAYCYRISAVDRSGNESELTEPQCNDNCPYFELPNVFTPSEGDDCNSTFGAYRDPLFYANGVNEDGSVRWECGEVAAGKCARFVQAVSFRVYNRWGKEVYNNAGDSERSIYIDWDGRGTDGTELAAGVYYYAAEVTFLVVDPAKRTQTFKGWVHLVR